MQDSDQQTKVTDSWGHQRSLSLVSSDRQAGVVELYHWIRLQITNNSDSISSYLFDIADGSLRLTSLSLGFDTQLFVCHQVRWTDFSESLIENLKLSISDSHSSGALNRLTESLIKTETNYQSLMNRRFTEHIQWYFFKLKAKLTIYIKFWDIIIWSVPMGAGSTIFP